MSIIAAFNAVVIGAAALIVGVPLAGTIAVVTFVGAYVPFVGAWVAGAFAVLIALGTVGTDAAVVMAVVSLLANSVLQQVIQPLVMGATLSLNPLVVLVVTIGAGALFGMVGLTLAAPLTSAAVHIVNELRDKQDAPVVQTGAGAGAVWLTCAGIRQPVPGSGLHQCRPLPRGPRRARQLGQRRTTTTGSSSCDAPSVRRIAKSSSRRPREAVRARRRARQGGDRLDAEALGPPAHDRLAGHASSPRSSATSSTPRTSRRAEPAGPERHITQSGR